MTESVAIPTYILTISLTYCIAIYYLYRRAKTFHYSVNMALDIALVVMICGFLGARLFHIFYENFDYYKENPAAAFKIWEGGFVFFGGFLAALVGSFLFIKRRQESFLFWADFYAPVIALSYGLGRVACFLNGCCYGKLCDLPWAVSFDGPGLPVGARHPTQLYATLWEISLFAILYIIEGKRFQNWLHGKGRLFGFWLLFHGFGRILIEAFRDDWRGKTILNLSIASWISLAVILSGCVLLCWRRKTR